MKPDRIFYHADLAGRLTENQPIDLIRGLSRFGLNYEHALNQDYRCFNGHIRRELCLERIRVHNKNVDGRVPSRLSAIFACISIDDARTFAHKSGAPNKADRINIFEIIARPRSFNFRDMNWLDFPESSETAMHYVSYWSEILTQADHGNPFIEVCIQLPARTGRIVDTVTIDPQLPPKDPLRSAP